MSRPEGSRKADRPRFVLTLAILIMVFASAAIGAAEESWQSLFDGKTLGSWKSTEFGGEGKVSVSNGQINLQAGTILTGVTWSGAPIPKSGYEISLEAKRTDGSDFFCGLTFPVGESHCSLILGGWGGSLVGISSIDGMDASENDTTQMKEFVRNQWYKVRVKVSKAKIEAWIDDKNVVDLPRAGKKFSTRIEVDLSQPLGIAAYMTGAALRDIKIRKVE
jgi:hypothetical protein